MSLKEAMKMARCANEAAENGDAAEAGECISIALTEIPNRRNLIQAHSMLRVAQRAVETRDMGEIAECTQIAYNEMKDVFAGRDQKLLSKGTRVKSWRGQRYTVVSAVRDRRATETDKTKGIRKGARLKAYEVKDDRGQISFFDIGQISKLPSKSRSKGRFSK